MDEFAFELNWFRLGDVHEVSHVGVSKRSTLWCKAPVEILLLLTITWPWRQSLKVLDVTATRMYKIIKDKPLSPFKPTRQDELGCGPFPD